MLLSFMRVLYHGMGGSTSTIPSLFMLLTSCGSTTYGPSGRPPVLGLPSAMLSAAHPFTILILPVVPTLATDVRDVRLHLALF